MSLMASSSPPEQPVPSQVARAHRTALLFCGLCLGLYVLGGLYFGQVFLLNLRALLTQPGAPTRQAPVAGPVDAPTLLEPSPIPSPAPPDARPSSEPSMPLPMWAGQKPVSLLLLGVDRRADEPAEQARTDTMLLLVISPETKTAAMVSLPRDLWVQIPGHGEQRINVAHALGGPGLAKQTVAHTFGVPVDHFARVDFDGFEQLVGTLGGVLIDVERPITDDAYPTEDYGTTRIYIPAGPQLMDGETALQYVRSRHSEDDFGRMRRQQRFLVALRERALQANVLPQLPALLGLAQRTLATDLGPAQMLGLARLGAEIERERITTLVLDTRYVQPYRSPVGADLLLPNGQAIQAALRELLAGAE